MVIQIALPSSSQKAPGNPITWWHGLFKTPWTHLRPYLCPVLFDLPLLCKLLGEKSFFSPCFGMILFIIVSLGGECTSLLIALLYNSEPKCTCKEGRTEESIWFLTVWHQGWMEGKVFKGSQTTHIVTKSLAEQQVNYLLLSMPPLCHFWSSKCTDARMWEWIQLPLLRSSPAQLLCHFK